MSDAQAASPSPLRSLVLGLLALSVASLAALTLGALFVHLIGGDLGPRWARVLAGTLALALVFIAPFNLAFRLIKGMGERAPHRPSVTLGALLLWDGALLAGLLLATPTATADALRAHGTWWAMSDPPAQVAQGLSAFADLLSPAEAGPIEFTENSASDIEGATLSEEDLQVSELEPLEPPPPLPEGPWTARDVFTHRAASVVVIHSRAKLSDDHPFAELIRTFGGELIEGSGSGFVVSEDGLIVTNHHVIQGAEQLQVQLKDGRVFDQVELLIDDPAHDLALLRVNAQGLTPTPVAETETEDIGGRVFALGSPLGLEYTLTEGIISATRLTGDTRFLQIQATIAPGSSGGPLFDEAGEVVGVNTAVRSPGLGLSVRAGHVQDLLVAERAPQPYAPFTRSLELTSLTVEGRDLTPVGRMQLEQLATMLGERADACVDEAPPEARLSFQAPLGGFGGRGALTTNLGEEAEACLQDGVGMVGFFLTSTLASEGEGPVRVTVGFDGLSAGPEDERPPEARTLEVVLQLGELEEAQDEAAPPKEDGAAG